MTSCRSTSRFTDADSKCAQACQTDIPGSQHIALSTQGGSVATAADSDPSGATKMATPVIVTAPTTSGTQTAIIDSWHVAHQSEEELGENLPPKLAETVNNIAWHVYSEQEVSTLYKESPPPKNVDRLHTITQTLEVSHIWLAMAEHYRQT